MSFRTLYCLTWGCTCANVFVWFDLINYASDLNRIGSRSDRDLIRYCLDLPLFDLITSESDQDLIWSGLIWIESGLDWIGSGFGLERVRFGLGHGLIEFELRQVRFGSASVWIGLGVCLLRFCSGSGWIWFGLGRAMV